PVEPTALAEAYHAGWPIKAVSPAAWRARPTRRVHRLLAISHDLSARPQPSQPLVSPDLSLTQLIRDLSTLGPWVEGARAASTDSECLTLCCPRRTLTKAGVCAARALYREYQRQP